MAQGAGPSGSYSREPARMGGRRLDGALDQIPAGLWADVKAKTKRDGISLRALILSLLRKWLSECGVLRLEGRQGGEDKLLDSEQWQRSRPGVNGTEVLR